MGDTLTRTGSIREGFEYQDLYGVAVLIEWLEHPERYDWVAFEEDDFGFLDDVVRCTPDLKLTLSQIKHSGISGSYRLEISLSQLLEQPKGKKGSKSSLLQKWFKSWVDAVDQHRFSDVGAELLTNRTAADSLLRLIKKDSDTGLLTLDANKLKSDASAEWKALLAQTGADASLVENFLDELVLRFDYLEIDVQRAALSLRAQALGISSSGFRDLEDAARKWAKPKFQPARSAVFCFPGGSKSNNARHSPDVFFAPKNFVALAAFVLVRQAKKNWLKNLLSRCTSRSFLAVDPNRVHRRSLLPSPDQIPNPRK
jgi:hypothetical protein